MHKYLQTQNQKNDNICIKTSVQKNINIYSYIDTNYVPAWDD